MGKRKHCSVNHRRSPGPGLGFFVVKRKQRHSASRGRVKSKILANQRLNKLKWLLLGAFVHIGDVPSMIKGDIDFFGYVARVAGEALRHLSQMT